MWYPNRKQWWVIWVATALVLLAWWGDLDRATIAKIDERLPMDADYTRLQKELDESERGGHYRQMAELALLQGKVTEGVRDRARAEERLTRTVGSVIALASLLVWFLGGRSRSTSN